MTDKTKHPRTEPIMTNHLQNLEGDIAATIRGEVVPMPKPKPDISRLTSEAVQAQYEHAAQSVEALGEAIRDSVFRLEATLADHANDLKLIADAANHIRAKGETVRMQIAEASALTHEIREACANFTKMVS